MTYITESVAFTCLSMVCWLIACFGLVYSGGFKYEVAWVPFLITPFGWGLSGYWLWQSRR